MDKKQLLSKVIDLYMLPLKRLFSKNHKDFIINSICNSFDDDVFVSYRLRTLKPAESIPMIDNFCEGNKFAIILQGPIGNNFEFLLETIKFYEKMYPNAIVIVSTWNDENNDNIDVLRNNNVVCVQSYKPNISGTLNVNFQVKSTLAGINKAKELGIEFVAKTRTDQRICRPYVMYSMIDMLENFKPNSPKLNYRIVATATYCDNMFTPFYLSDFFFLGHIKDLENYFSCPYDERETRHPGKISRKELSKSVFPPEIYLMKSYLKTYLGYRCDDTVKEYWQSLKDCFICMGRSDIDLLTLKYVTKRMDHINNSKYFVKDTQERKYLMGFNFWTWYELYNGNISYKEEYEKETEVMVD